MVVTEKCNIGERERNGQRTDDGLTVVGEGVSIAGWDGVEIVQRLRVDKGRSLEALK